MTIGLCSKIADTCDASIEWYSKDFAKVKLRQNLNKWGHSYYGRSIYAAARKALIYPAKIANERIGLFLVSINNSKRPKEIYLYPDKKTSGYWGLFYSAVRDVIFVADAENSQTGTITMINNDDQRESFPTMAIPYSGVVVDF
jgi:hypothetical protein